MRGATRVLSSGSRPVILAEVQDLRTEPWGYPAREIIKFLSQAAYRWFALNADSSLQPVSTELMAYDANLVAVPDERVGEFETAVETGTEVIFRPPHRVSAPGVFPETLVATQEMALLAFLAA